MTPKTLAALILCNLIWSAHPAMGKLLLADVSPATGAWLRYASALFAFVLALILFHARRGIRIRDGFLVPGRRRDWVALAALGLMTFCFSPLLQLTGLEGSRATDNSLIIAMEPLFTVLLGWLFLRETISALQLAAFLVALAGFGMLSGISAATFSRGLDSHLLANLILLLSLTGEASYSVLGRKLMARYSPMKTFGTAIVIGVAFLSCAVIALRGLHPAAELANLSWRGIFALVWLGPLGTTATYLYWMFALVEVPLASIALTLFIQPLCGAIWGHVFLGDRLTSIQAAGGALILGAVFAETGRHIVRKRNVP